MTHQLTREQAVAVVERARLAIQRYFQQHNLAYAVFGKSEGLDSSVIAGLLSDLPGIKPIGVLLPIESNPQAERIGRLVLDHFQIPSIKVDLTAEYHALASRFYSSGSVQEQLLAITNGYRDQALHRAVGVRKGKALGNIKVRLRMITLYHIAQLTGGVVISTDNLSELWMGFWTLNGDVGDLSPIQHVWKGLEEYALANVLGVPEESLRAVPTDGLEITPGNRDEDQLGLPYNELDKVIIRLLQEKFDGSGNDNVQQRETLVGRIAAELGHSPSTVADVAQQMCRTHFKRHWPHVITRQQLGLPDVETLSVSETTVKATAAG